MLAETKINRQRKFILLEINPNEYDDEAPKCHEDAHFFSQFSSPVIEQRLIAQHKGSRVLPRTLAE